MCQYCLIYTIDKILYICYNTKNFVEHPVQTCFGLQLPRVEKNQSKGFEMKALRNLMITVLLAALMMCVVFGIGYGLKAYDNAHATDIEVIQTSSAVKLSSNPYAMPEELAARLTDVQFREVTAIWEFDDQNPELPSSHSWIIKVENVSAFIDSLASEHLPPTLTSNGTPNRELMVVTVGEPIARESYYSGIDELGWVITQTWRAN